MKNILKKSVTTVILGSIVVSLLSSCGQKSSSDSNSSENNDTPVASSDIRPQVDEELDGQYLAVLNGLNEQVAGKVSGALTMAREEKQIIGDVRFSAGPLSAATVHVQNVHVGGRCPGSEDDTNGDGFIDAFEGDKVYGNILIPLDSDLNSQRVGLGIFPVSDDYGGYIYSRAANFERFLSDLRDNDINEKDNITKINAGERLNLMGKVVVIKGVAQAAILPETVATNNNFANYQTIPIACGVISKVTTPPGTPDDDEEDLPIPGASVGGTNGGSDGTVIINRPGPGTDGETAGGSTGETTDDTTTGGSTTGGSTGETTDDTTTGGSTIGGTAGGTTGATTGDTTTGGVPNNYGDDDDN